MQKFRLDDPGGTFCLQKYDQTNSEANQTSVMIILDEDWSYNMYCEIFKGYKINLDLMSW